MRWRLLVVLLAFAMLLQASTGLADESDLGKLIDDYYYAIGENRLDEAMALYHEDSPDAERANQELRYGQTAYLQRTHILNLDLVHRDSERAMLRVEHRHLRIVGIKFIEAVTEGEYIMHRQDETWKIWSIKERRINHRLATDSKTITDR